MSRMSNALHLGRASWNVLTQDRELIVVPILAGAAAILAFCVVAAPGALLAAAGDSDSSSSNPALYIFLALGAVAAAWMSAIGQAAVVAGAAERMDGYDPTVRSAFKAARARGLRLLQWAVLATVVALVLDQLEQRFALAGRIAAWLGGAAFSILSFLALPVIVFENIGAIAAFKRSAQLLKSTWGEQITFGFGMGLLTFLLMIPPVIVGILGLSTGLLPLQILGVGIAAVAIVVILAVTSAMSAVFKTALYRYATDQPVDPAFSDADLHSAFSAAKGATGSPPPLPANG
jgi:hypothetical protein